MVETPQIIGLTGTLASGKTFVADCFRRCGVAVFDADKQVHRILDSNQQVIESISRQFPQVVVNHHVVRSLLSDLVVADKQGQVLAYLEKIIHPHVKEHMEQFLSDHSHAPMVVLDIPLLFETAWHKKCHFVMVTCASEAEKQQRALQRPHMDLKKYHRIQKQQLSQQEKLQKADFVINTEEKEEKILSQVKEIMNRIVPAVLS